MRAHLYDALELLDYFTSHFARRPLHLRRRQLAEEDAAPPPRTVPLIAMAWPKLRAGYHHTIVIAISTTEDKILAFSA